MPDLKWADIKLALDARGLTLCRVEGTWRLVDKDTGIIPTGMPRKYKDLAFVPCQKPKGSPGRGYPEGYNPQEKTQMSDVDWRIQQTDLKQLCQRAAAIDMTKTITQQQTGAVALVIRWFLKLHPEYEVWAKFGYWNIRAGIQLILRVSACEAKKLGKRDATLVKPRKPRGKPRGNKTASPTPAGQLVIVDKPVLEDEGTEAFNLDDVTSDNEHERQSEPEDEPEDENKPEDENEDEPWFEQQAEAEPELAGSYEDNPKLEQEVPGLEEIELEAGGDFEPDGDEDDDNGIFDIHQVIRSSLAPKLAPATCPATSGPPMCLSAPSSTVVTASARPPTSKLVPASAPPAGALNSRPSSTTRPIHPSVSGNTIAVKSTGSTEAVQSSPPAQGVPAPSQTHITGKPAAKTISPPLASPQAAHIPASDSAGPVRKPTVPIVSAMATRTIVWYGLKITARQMAAIRANAECQAAGDPIRASPIYQVLIDKLAADPDYDPASEPDPPPPPAPTHSGRKRNAAPIPAPTIPASATTNIESPIEQPRIRPRPKLKPAPVLEPEAVADDETDSNLALLETQGSEDEELSQPTTVRAAMGGKATRKVAGGKGKDVAEGERAPATARKGQVGTKVERVGTSTSAAMKKTQGKKPAKETVTEPSTLQSLRTSTRPNRK
ncbi:hypothetical protein FRC06_004240 [Ceratobasidium sp. 370]|nr:hypothetical protein FRC06_004240 [Ceratobasidium sp. 370]